jgi:hypothetical protein
LLASLIFLLTIYSSKQAPILGVRQALLHGGQFELTPPLSSFFSLCPAKLPARADVAEGTPHVDHSWTADLNCEETQVQCVPGNIDVPAGGGDGVGVEEEKLLFIIPSSLPSSKRYGNGFTDLAA